MIEKIVLNTPGEEPPIEAVVTYADFAIGTHAIQEAHEAIFMFDSSQILLNKADFAEVEEKIALESKGSIYLDLSSVGNGIVLIRRNLCIRDFVNYTTADAVLELYNVCHNWYKI